MSQIMATLRLIERNPISGGALRPFFLEKYDETPVQTQHDHDCHPVRGD